MTISKRRQEEIKVDKGVVEFLYRSACNQHGKSAIDKDLTRLWDLRCSLGMSRDSMLPFGSTKFKNLEEMLWIVRNVCNLEDEHE